MTASAKGRGSSLVLHVWEAGESGE